MAAIGFALIIVAVIWPGYQLWLIVTGASIVAWASFVWMTRQR